MEERPWPVGSSVGKSATAEWRAVRPEPGKRELYSYHISRQCAAPILVDLPFQWGDDVLLASPGTLLPLNPLQPRPGARCINLLSFSSQHKLPAAPEAVDRVGRATTQVCYTLSNHLRTSESLHPSYPSLSPTCSPPVLAQVIGLIKRHTLENITIWYMIKC